MSVNGDVRYKEVPTKENEAKKPKEIPSSYGYGVRHIQLLLAGLSITISFIVRSHIGVTIVAMTSKPNLNNTSYVYNASIATNATNFNTEIGDNNDTNWEEDLYPDNFTIFDEDFYVDNFTAAKNHSTLALNENKIMTYDWPKSTQETVLGSFFLGYSIMMFPMGMVSQRWGGKVPIQLCLLVNGLAAIFTPWLMIWGNWKAICGCRILQGLTQAGLVPGIQVIISRWSSFDERGKFATYVYTGTTVGAVIAFQLAGFLAASPWGWPSTFWVSGGLCLIMFVILTIFGSASPAEHKTISEEERSFIMGNMDREVKKQNKVPWKSILTSKPVWATICTHVGSGLGFIFFFNQCPSYIHHILKMDVKKSGILSSLPYAGNVIMNIVYGLLTDFISSKKILSLANSRRAFNTFSQFGITLSFVAVSFTKNIVLAVTCLVLAMSFHAGVHCGWMVNQIDLAPNYVATLMGIGNTITCTLSVLMPVLISYVVTDMTNQFQWRIMFLLMATMTFTSNIVFVLFMSTDTQPWNDNHGYEQTGSEDKLKNEKQEKNSQRI